MCSWFLKSDTNRHVWFDTVYCWKYLLTQIVFCPENYNTVDATFALIFTVLLSNHKFAGPNRIFLKLTIRGSIIFKANQEIGCNFTNYSVLWGFVTNRIILYGFRKLLTCSTKSSFCKISNIRGKCHRSFFTMRYLSHSLLSVKIQAGECISCLKILEFSLKTFQIRVMRFTRRCVCENCVLLGYDGSSLDDQFPTFRKIIFKGAGVVREITSMRLTLIPRT